MMWIAVGALLLSIAGVFGLALLIDAFKESVAQGLRCTFVPFYIVYYAFARYESPKKPMVLGGWLGGMALGLVLTTAGAMQATDATASAVGDLESGHWEATGETNVGMRRAHNEDRYAVIDEEHLYVVADGMGGHASGEVASRMAIDTLRELFRTTDSDPEAPRPSQTDQVQGGDANRLTAAIKLANRRIHEAAQRDPELRGMGTTVVAILAVDEGVLVSHVGDSRVYRLRDDELVQLTEDHSLLNEYIKTNNPSEEEIASFRYKNVIVRALGAKETVEVDATLDEPKPGDVYILCSDGLQAGHVSDDEIRAIIASTEDLDAATKQLIERANEGGGPDNITVVLARFMGAR